MHDTLVPKHAKLERAGQLAHRSRRLLGAIAGFAILSGCAAPGTAAHRPPLTAVASASCAGRPACPATAPAQAATRPAYTANRHDPRVTRPVSRTRPQYGTPSRTPIAPSARTARPMRPDTRATDSERRVARFVARPSDVFRPPTPLRRWQYIVLHHSATESGSLASIDRHHREQNGWDECGYHFVIGNGTESGDGEIEVGSRWAKQKHGAHCKHPDHPEYNSDGIGICLVGNLDRGPPTAKQIEACRRLVEYLAARCDVPPNHVTTHGDLVTTNCPGRYFPHDELLPRRSFAAR